MCGIAGIIDYGRKFNTGPAIDEMLRAITHRGPDECGYYISETAAIGNVRLSIIDLSGGQQPMSDASGRYWIVFNGEIFNYRELKEELQKKGCSFSNQSDTEVLVQLYAMYGSSCLNMLNGQFALAIWDKKKEELFLARDRVGIRPLFFNLRDGILTFASEIKAIFTNKRIERELDLKSLSQVYTFWTTVSPDTAFKNIYEIPPGHFAHFSRSGMKVSKFWELKYEGPDRSISFEDACGKFHELFSDAVRIRLRADVEVAAYLSGGIDSSATVAYIKDIEPGVLNTFSIGFEEKDFDESVFQNEAVRFFGTTHKSITCPSDEIAEAFPRVVWHSEMPLTRTAPVPMFLLSKLVRDNNIKVVITGEGSDEILAGYDIFKEDRIRRFWASQPASAFRPLLLKRLYPDLPHLRDATPNILKMFFGFRLGDTGDPFYSHLLRWNNSNHIKKHFLSGNKTLLEGYSPLAILEKNLPGSFMEWDPLSRSQWLETTIFMSGYLLSSQGDRMGMANSIEGRYPFLDYRVIEFCASLPGEFKLKGLTEKYLLKRLLVNKIPGPIIKRPKQPYRAPIRSVFTGRKKKEYVSEMLSESFTRKAAIFDNESVASLVARVEKSGTSSEVDNMILAAVISTHLLFHQFILGNNSEFIAPGLSNIKVIEDFKL